MKFELYADVVLRCDVAEHRLRRGDIVKLVDHHVVPDGTEGYSIEVFNALGDTIASPVCPHPPSKPSAKMKYSAPAPCNGAGDGFPSVQLSLLCAEAHH